MSDSCACPKCVACCERKPGWFAPGEAEKAAELLGITFEAFRSEYLVREYWCSDSNVYVYAPRQTHDPNGFITPSWSAGFNQGPCVFLTSDKRCRIHDAKPTECRDSYGCRPVVKKREDIKEQWSDIGNPLATRGAPDAL